MTFIGIWMIAELRVEEKVVLQMQSWGVMRTAATFLGTLHKMCSRSDQIFNVYTLYKHTISYSYHALRLGKR